MTSLRDQLIGAWELVEYQAYLTTDHTNTIHPMGKHATGIIMYTPDGYMSAQIQSPGVTSFERPGSESNWAEIGRSYVAYTGRFWVDEKGDEKGPLLVHEMRYSIWPSLHGQRQRRLVQIREEEDGRYLYLGPEKPQEMGGVERVPALRWKRLEENCEERAPEV